MSRLELRSRGSEPALLTAYSQLLLLEGGTLRENIGRGISAVRPQTTSEAGRGQRHPASSLLSPWAAMSFLQTHTSTGSAETQNALWGEEVAELRLEPSSPCWLSPGSSGPGISPLNLRMKEECRPGANLERPGTPLALQVTQQEKDSPGQALIFLVRH